jgi:hypothetical protein
MSFPPQPIFDTLQLTTAERSLRCSTTTTTKPCRRSVFYTHFEYRGELRVGTATYDSIPEMDWVEQRVERDRKLREGAEPKTFFWTCRPCNVRCGNTLRNAGIGRLTRQFNPSASGANSLGQWLTAVTSMQGKSTTMRVHAAVEMIRATPSDRRSECAKEIWQNRRARYGPSGCADSVPF